MKIAFVGVGNMGGGMAANLVKAGHDVRAFDLSQAALDAAAERGCTPFTDPKAAMLDAEAVVTMLPNGAIVGDFYRENVFGHAPTSAILIDCSTIDVATARAVAADAAAAGYAMVDAPVSGGIAAADAGTLTFMLGGRAAQFAAAEPVLSKMGKAVIHAGDSGARQ
jgi:3-hydroxyisobutyrate dehydrogenase